MPLLAGANNAKFMSNTFVLDKLGWKGSRRFRDEHAEVALSVCWCQFARNDTLQWHAGTCVDPFPLLFEEENRTCNVVRSVVSDTSGQEVKFAKSSQDALSGIEATWSSANKVMEPGATVMVTLTTVGCLS